LMANLYNGTIEFDQSQFTINSLLIFSMWWEISIDVRNIENLSHLLGKLNN